MVPLLLDNPATEPVNYFGQLPAVMMLLAPLDLAIPKSMANLMRDRKPVGISRVQFDTETARTAAAAPAGEADLDILQG
jgi:hypothetical protein